MPIKSIRSVCSGFFVVSFALFTFAQDSVSTNNGCLPPCRSGYLCVDGKCVERCNPPCPPGERCDDSGNCVSNVPVGTTNMVAPSQVKAEVVSPTSAKSVAVSEQSAPRDNVSSNAQNKIQETTKQLPQVLGKIGVGFGVPYGVLGVGGEIGTQYVTLLTGIGTAVLGAGWSVGGRVYFANSTKKWRPHFSVVYGTTMVYDLTGGPEELSGTLNGFGFYLGEDHDIGKIGGFILTYGIGVITRADDIPSDAAAKWQGWGQSMPDIPGASVKINVGVNYRFGG